MFKEEYLKIPFFRNFTVEDLTHLLQYASEADYEKDAIIFHQGDPGRELYVITSGSVRFQRKGADGKIDPLSTASYGNLFGELAFLQPQARTATAIAAEPTKLLVFQKADVQKLIDLYPTLAATFYHAVALELAQRLKETTARL